MNLNGNEATVPSGRVGLLATIGSVLMAMLGVQSSKVRERDFTRGNPWLFVAVAVAMTGAFAATLMLVVRMLVRAVAA